MNSNMGQIFEPIILTKLNMGELNDNVEICNLSDPNVHY